MVAEDENTFAKGRRVDRYEIRAPIGEGGMGAVYRAFDTKLGRTVALKTVVARRRTSLSEELRGRFTREALAASKVNHRNVVQVLDYGFADDGSPYIVMEYLRGQDLGARLRQSGEPLAVDYVADVMLSVCAALQACHQAGIVHRDLKPANIFLADTDTGSEVKVLDFGVSKAQLAGDLTEEGQILGTPQFLSPEQVEGKTVPESDQYALGMVLYVCLTKHMPYEEHESLSLLRAIELGRFQRPRVHRPDLPPPLEEIILRALRLSPSDRFESVHALGRQLLPFASARGRGQWRDYYLQTPAARPKESTLGLAMLEEAAPETPRAAPLAAGLASTEAVSEDLPAGPERYRPQARISTKLEESPPRVPASAAEGSLLDVAGESTQGEPTGDRRQRPALRRLVVGFLAGFGLVAGALLIYARQGHDRAPLPRPALERTERPVPAPAAAPSPTIAVPAPAPPPGPPLAAPPPAKPAELLPARPVPPPATARASDLKPPSPRVHKRARRDKGRSPVEAAPDGVPIMP
jgi:serine/threonine-protein kinase